MKLLIVVLFLIVHSQLDDKVVFVMIHFRHGARAPTTLKNNIDDNGEEWLIPGELSAVGERMHYLLGLRNRVRYINEKKFLSEKFNSKELEVISTNVERTIASLSSHLQGLYPQSEQLGRTLTDTQLKTSDPPFKVDNSRITQEKNELDKCSLPNYMTLIPFKTMSLDGKSSAASYVTEFSDYPGAQYLENELNEKYKKNFDQLKEDNNVGNYTFYEGVFLCDSFIPNYIDGREITKLKNTKLNFEEFYDFCLRIK